MVFTNEQNDIYMACTGYFDMTLAHIMKNGFVCIPAGKQRADETKTWDMSNTSIEGSTINRQRYSTASILAVERLLLCRYCEMVITPYTARNSMAVIIDLNTKTIKKIEEYPTQMVIACNRIS